MKTHTRKLLVILPLLPLLMANSPAPYIREQEYKDFQVTYVKEETLHGYYFYTFNINNTGNGYIQSINIYSDEKSFSSSIYDEDVCPPFYNGLLEPGFNGERVFVTRSKIPESKIVKTNAYAYLNIAEEVTLKGTKEISCSIEGSSADSGYYAYTIDCSFENMDDNYYYAAAIKITYDGNSYFVKSNNARELEFSAREKLDLTKLTIDEVAPLKSERYNYFYGGCGANFEDAILPLLLFLLIFGLLLSFGIFAAIFFPAMARRRRRKALLAKQEKDNEKESK